MGLTDSHRARHLDSRVVVDAAGPTSLFLKRKKFAPPANRSGSLLKRPMSHKPLLPLSGVYRLSEGLSGFFACGATLHSVCSRSSAPAAGRARFAPVAQLDRALDYGSEGWEFESLRARHFLLDKTMSCWAAAGVSGQVCLRRSMPIPRMLANTKGAGATSICKL